MAVASPERLRGDLARPVHHGAGMRDFSRDAGRSLARAVPFDGICTVAMDPATPLPTTEVVENGLPASVSPRTATRCGLTLLRAADRASFAAADAAHHLKAIFEKTGVSTRGELVARLFFEHHAPRLRDAPE